MMRWLGFGLAAISLIAIGFFLQDAGQMLGWIEKPEKKSSGGGRQPWASGAGGGYPQGGDASQVPVEVSPATVETIRERVLGSGLLEPAREVLISARIEGEVEQLLVEEGDSIAADAPFCAIDEEPLRLAAEVARIERDQTKLAYDRLKSLGDDGRTITPQELEEARFAMERAAANHSRAALDLAHARPTAPFAGVVIDRAVELGQSVRPGDPLFTIADFEPLRLRLSLPESAVGPIVVGQVAELRSDREGPVLTRGSVERISPVVDRESLTIEVVCSFEFAKGSVRPGSFAHVDIITKTEEDVVLVPRRAVIDRDGETIVYRIVDGRAHRAVVLTGYEDESVVQIREGVAAGDRVATEGVRELRDGADVEIYRDVGAPPTEGTAAARPSGRSGS